MRKIKVAVGLSGGVDSAVSAYLLKKQGFDVSGVYLNCFDDDIPGCRGEQDRQDALSVALHLKLPFQVLDFRKEYKSAVIDYFKKEYLAGRTPNPDVVCNRDIKFGLLLDWCIKNRFDYLATGHYAKLIQNTRKTRKAGVSDNQNIRKPELIRLSDSPNFRFSGTQSFLSIPKDLHKDQTYFLWAVPRQKFSRVLFPLADFRKKDVRSVAKFAKIPVADKPDSTGICFVGEVRVKDFLKRLGVREKEGEAVIGVCGKYQENSSMVTWLHGSENDSHETMKQCNNSVGRKPKPHRHTDSCYQAIGSHRGIWFYTIGQRHGFSVDRWPPTDRPPLYVISKDVRRNRLVVGFGAETYRDSFEVSDCNWLVSEKDSPSGTGRTVLCRIRHLGDLIPCQLLSVSSRKLKVALATPARGVAPGQSAVFYSKEGIVLGGGVIQ